MRKWQNAAQLRARPKACRACRARLPTQTSFTEQDIQLLGVDERLYLSHHILADDGKYYSPTSELPFEFGGRRSNNS
jgi:hypothetical protein